VAIRISDPAISSEKEDLFTRFHAYGQQVKGWPETTADRLGLLLDNPFPVEEWSYRFGGRLVAVGYVDVLPEALSAIYFYWDPTDRNRSLGTLNIMAMIASARERKLAHVYLGYFVAGCRSLEYKARFRPNELRGSDGAWEPFVR
jgi:arginine-tRNA-protein transferase